MHNINEDYEHYRKRKTKEDILNNSYLLIGIGLIMLVSAYFLKTYSMGFVGVILIIIGFFFFRNELSPDDRILFNKYYPTALIVLAIILTFFSYYLNRLMLIHPNDKSAEPILNFIYLTAGIFFWWGLIVIIIRYVKSKRKHKFY